MTPSDAPHLAQNRRPSRLSCWHREQFILRPPPGPAGWVKECNKVSRAARTCARVLRGARSAHRVSLLRDLPGPRGGQGGSTLLHQSQRSCWGVKAGNGSSSLDAVRHWPLAALRRPLALPEALSQEKQSRRASRALSVRTTRGFCSGTPGPSESRQESRSRKLRPETKPLGKSLIYRGASPRFSRGHRGHPPNGGFRSGRMTQE